jgi:predicted RNase H-like HicB family nuclease
MKIKAIIHPAEEGGYWAEVPALPGCITEGDTMEEVMANLKDAIEGWLDVANSRHAIESTDHCAFADFDLARGNYVLHSLSSSS